MGKVPLHNLRYNHTMPRKSQHNTPLGTMRLGDTKSRRIYGLAQIGAIRGSQRLEAMSISSPAISLVIGTQIAILTGQLGRNSILDCSFKPSDLGACVAPVANDD
jgi:hypothetical protein